MILTRISVKKGFAEFFAPPNWMLQNLWVQLLFQKKWHSIRNKKKMLWIKHYDYPPTRISHSNWSNIDYLATNIRKELQIKGEVVIQDSLDQKEIEPAISLNRFTTCVLSTLKTRLIADCWLRHSQSKKDIYHGNRFRWDPSWHLF